MSWKEELSKYCTSPENHSQVIFYNQDVSIIKDLYPKSKIHYLIMPRVSIEFGHLTNDHIPLIKILLSNAENMKSKHQGIEFLLGFHAVPSMKQLHLHMISNDFDSSKLKLKKHYLSFTTKFFISPTEIIRRLERNERLNFTELEGLLKGELICSCCNLTFKTMPKLKIHLAELAA
jgi:aprataxin